MAKPENIPIEGKNYYAWQYEGQTQIKHKVFGAYWKIWVSKLGCYSDTLLFDCHGGCGAYIDENGNIFYGSSINADKIASEVNLKRNHHNYVCTCDIDSNNLENLKKVWVDQNCSKYFMPKCSDYNVVIADKKAKQYYYNNPTLFFIDPFGYYNTPMKGMADLLKGRGNEIIINFMFDFLNRGISISKIDETQLTDFFGCEDWKKARDLFGDDREKFLVNVYRENLKKTTGAKFVFAYRLSYPNRKHTYYYLIHATNNVQGMTHMKNSFASVNNGRIEYLGKHQDELTIFDLSSYKTNELAESCLAKFAGKKISFIELWIQIVESVPYLEKDLAEAIRLLESEKKLTVQRITSKRGSYRDEDLISFEVQI